MTATSLTPLLFTRLCWNYICAGHFKSFSTREVSPLPENLDFATAFHPLITNIRQRSGVRFGFPAYITFQLRRPAWPPSCAPAAASRLINTQPWWVETPCHRLLSQRKSIKNNTHLYPRVQSPFVFSCLPAADAFLSTSDRWKWAAKPGGAGSGAEGWLFQNLRSVCCSWTILPIQPRNTQ